MALFAFFQNSPQSEFPSEQYTDILLVPINGYPLETLASLESIVQQSFTGVEVRISDSILNISIERMNTERQQFDFAEVLNNIPEFFSHRSSTHTVVG